MPDLPFEIPTNYGALTLAQLSALETQAVEAAGPLRDRDPNEVTDDDLATLQQLRDVVVAVRTERAARTGRAAQHAELAADLTPVPAPVPPPPPDPQPQDPPADPPPPPQDPGVAVTAAPRVTQVATRMPQLQNQLPATREFDPAEFAQLVVNPDVAREFTNWRDVAQFAERRLAAYTGLRGSGRHTVATIRREFPEELRSTGDDDETLVQFAVDERRLPGNSLVAAAGWCAPSQTVYDLCELETNEGMIDVPEVQITRGGLRFTPGPNFAEIFAGAGFFHQTEAQVIANTTKPCMEISCPAFTDVRLEVEGLCITGAILQRRGYPELVERFIRGALVAHMHKINQFVIAQMVAGSTAVDLCALPAGGVAEDGTTTALLSSVELAAEDIRYRNRMRFNQTIEVVLPHWVLPQIRADFSRRTGVEMVNVTDAMINEWFAARGARVQYVYDWQDAFSGLATGPGGAAPLTFLPTEVQFLAYPAGTWLRGSDSTIRLDTIYDSTLLATNRYTALFSEEGVLMAQVCNGGSRVYTACICPSGTTAATLAYNCV